MKPSILTVSQLNLYVKSILEESPLLQQVFVTGEISNFINHLRSGHYYMTLKDGQAAIKAVMFRGSNQHLKFMPENGMKVLVRGRVSLYERDGSYQLYIDDMQPDGVGALNLAFEQLKDRLAQEGLFDPERKKTLPPLPERIGVITSPTGAAVQDIKKVLRRRFPLAEIIFCPVQVQGAGAAPQLVDAITRFNQGNYADVLLLCRGGGSLEDLWAFNEEPVVRAVAGSKVPVITGIGHETDFTICDFAADLRAPTPSAAAELAVPDQYQQQAAIFALKSAMQKAWEQFIEQKRRQFLNLTENTILQSPRLLLEHRQQTLDAFEQRLSQGMERCASEKRSQFTILCEKLDLLSPFKILSRGYSITYRGKQVLSCAKEIEPGESIRTRFADGSLVSVVKCTEVEEEKTIHEKTNL